MLTLLFWTFFILIFYAYAGYPAALSLAARFFKRPVKKGAYEPSVSVIISAFNEEKNMERKLLNLLDLDYPAEKLEILVGSDGASDSTDAIISRFSSPRIRFFRFVENKGKPEVLKGLVQEARGEILLFTDARQDFDREAIHQLVRNFRDAQVGCVSGELYFRPEGDSAAIGKGMDAYWRYEKFLRKKESEMGSMLGATGAIYAVRRHLFPNLPSDILVDDMYIPLSIVARGFRAVFESGAWAYDRVSSKGKQEFTRKVRTLAGNYQIFQHFPALLIPGKSPIALQFFSHKVLRLTVPFFMIGVFVTNFGLLNNPFYLALMAAQIFFYLLAASEFYKEKKNKASVETKRKKGIAFIAYTFCLLNYSAFAALFHYLRIVRQKTPMKGAWQKAYA